MKQTFAVLLALVALATVSQAEMKCAPGKCGGGKCGSSAQTQKMSKIVYGNNTYQPIMLMPHQYRCAKCNMDITHLSYAAEAVAKNGDTYFFDDIGCMVLWLQKHSIPIAKKWTKTLDTHNWIKTEDAWYTRTASSPMHYGFAAYTRHHQGFVDYKTMRQLMESGAHLRNPKIRKKLLPQ